MGEPQAVRSVPQAGVEKQGEMRASFEAAEVHAEIRNKTADKMEEGWGAE